MLKSLFKENSKKVLEQIIDFYKFLIDLRQNIEKLVKKGLIKDLYLKTFAFVLLKLIGYLANLNFANWF